MMRYTPTANRSILLCLGLLFVLPTLAVAAEESESMELSNRHIGMSKAEVEADLKAANVEAKAAGSRTLVMESDAEGQVITNEWRSQPEEAEGEQAQGWEPRSTPEFRSCVVQSTEAGNGRDESERVCRVLFPPPEPTPEELAAQALAEAEARAAELHRLAEEKKKFAVEAAHRAEALRLELEQASARQ